MTSDDDVTCSHELADQRAGPGPVGSGAARPAPPDARHADAGPRSDVRHAGSVAVVVDGSVAAIGAARWAAALAEHSGRHLVAVVLLPAGADSQDEGRAALGRVEPTLRTAGIRFSVLTCRSPAARSGRQRAVRTVAEVTRCLAPVGVELLVLPGDPDLLDPRRRRSGLAAHLAAHRTYDLLIVPGLDHSPSRRPAPVGG